MIEYIIQNTTGRRMLKLDRMINLMKKNGHHTEAELVEKIEAIKIRGLSLDDVIKEQNGSANISKIKKILPKIPRIVYTSFKYMFTGNEPDFIIIDLNDSNGSNNLRMEFWYNGIREIHNETTDKTKERLSEALHYLIVRYRYPIGFNS